MSARWAVQGAFAASFAVALAAQSAPSPAPAARFERVLWTADPDAGVGVAARHGFTAVQLGRGADPAPAIGAALVSGGAAARVPRPEVARRRRTRDG